jgi:hypothetical protein
MYVILTSKYGQFRTEAPGGIRPIEIYDYLFYGSRRARFEIIELPEAELLREARIRIIDETSPGPGPGPGPGPINDIPARLLPRYASLEQARAELRHLTSFGRIATALERIR